MRDVSGPLIRCRKLTRPCSVTRSAPKLQFDRRVHTNVTIDLALAEQFNLLVLLLAESVCCLMCLRLHQTGRRKTDITVDRNRVGVMTGWNDSIGRTGAACEECCREDC